MNNNYTYPPCKPVMPPEKELARVYIKFQELDKVYNAKKALCKGTLFPELYKPYKQH